jgi:S-DNA-T family DNA segregation ATPase FtsK/SpoIIIE
MDVVGVIMALVGLLTLLSLLSARQGVITGWWIDLLQSIAGWGALLLPIGLIGLGLWLLFRNVERLPAMTTERLVGLVLLFTNLLTWFHLIAGGGPDLAAAGSGGGYIGNFFERIMVVNIGPVATVIGLLAWLLVALAFTLDISIRDLIKKLQPLWLKLKKALQQPMVRPSTRSSMDEVDEFPQPLPNGYQPLETRPATRQAERLQETRGQGHSKDRREAPSPPEDQMPADRLSGAPVRLSTMMPQPSWRIPPVEAILDPATPTAQRTNVDHERGRLIEETLASFGAPAHVVEIHRGPTITQFGVEPDFVESRNGRTRVRVAKIASLADDLALALAAQRIRIQAPVPGRNYVGIEVPNPEISRVTLREVMESEAFGKIKSPLRFALGKDVAGHSVAADLTSMPHLLIAGTTGSGKSVCVNSLLSCFLLNNTPADLRLVLVDPKRVELTGYNGIPHLLAPVVVDAERVIGALQWILREMDSRYHKFAQESVRNIGEYNRRHLQEKLPYIVVVVDELADLMMLAPEETERAITRLAQLARATGIHVIIATQRPSVDVVTGLIKANFPARIAFAVASGVDSRVILDQPGAERLLGRGDMLFQSPDASAPVRLQGTFVSDSEIQRLVDTWRVIAMETSTPGGTSGMAPDDNMLPRGVPLKQIALFDEPGKEAGSDPLLHEAIELIRKEGRASITMLQRRMRIGYTRAARLIDSMEERKIISQAQSNSPTREVLDYGQTVPPGDDGV